MVTNSQLFIWSVIVWEKLLTTRIHGGQTLKLSTFGYRFRNNVLQVVSCENELWEWNTVVIILSGRNDTNGGIECHLSIGYILFQICTRIKHNWNVILREWGREKWMLYSITVSYKRYGKYSKRSDIYNALWGIKFVDGLRYFCEVWFIKYWSGHSWHSYETNVGKPNSNDDLRIE